MRRRFLFLLAVGVLTSAVVLFHGDPPPAMLAQENRTEGFVLPPSTPTTDSTPTTTTCPSTTPPSPSQVPPQPDFAVPVVEGPRSEPKAEPAGLTLQQMREQLDDWREKLAAAEQEEKKLAQTIRQKIKQEKESLADFEQKIHNRLVPRPACEAATAPEPRPLQGLLERLKTQNQQKQEAVKKVAEVEGTIRQKIAEQRKALADVEQEVNKLVPEGEVPVNFVPGFIR
jgi:hypothetical protein